MKTPVELHSLPPAPPTTTSGQPHGAAPTPPPPPEPPTELDEEVVIASPRVPAGLRTDLSLPRQVAALAIWPFLEQLLGFLVGFVDTVVAGRLLSTEATSAVGAAVYVLWLMHLIMGSAAVGATALVARAVGAGRWRRANQILGQAVAFGAVWGVCVGVFFYFAAPLIARLTGLRGEGLVLCIRYLHIMAVAAPFSTLLAVSAACLRGSGNTRRPFLAMIVVNLINMHACVLLVAAWSPIGGHGIRGLALGTSLAWFVGAVLLLSSLGFSQKDLHLRYRNLVARWAVIARIVRVGLPNLLEGGGMWIGNFLVIMIVGRLPNTAAIGAHFVAVRIEALSYMPGFALGIAAATLTGQYLGAGDPKTARRAAWWCWGYGVGMMTLCGLLFVLLAEQLVGIVTDKQVFLDTSPELLRLAGFVQAGFGTAIVFSAVHRGAGDTLTAMALTYGSTFLVRLPLVYLLGVHLGLGLKGIWYAMCFELMFRGGLFLASFLRGGWARVKV
ncbi:MAG: MATE family efflux transporter [Planctomycetota bacterium]|nr:MATE family efflux transporter [Planctomycetota bacterium]